MNTTRIKVRAPGKATTFYDVPDTEVKKFKQDFDTEFQAINKKPSPFSYEEEPLIPK